MGKLGKVFALSAVVCTLGCSSKKTPPASLAGADPDSERELAAGKQSIGKLEDHFTSRVPALPGPFAAARFGLDQAALGALVPQFATSGQYFRTPELPEVSYYAVLSADGVFVNLRIGLPRARARSLLTAAWGEPTALSERKGTVEVWVNPETRVRAALEEDMEPTRSTLLLSPYVPVAELIGRGAERWGFEREPYLGKPAAAVKTLAGDSFRDATDHLIFLRHPATEWADEFAVEVGVHQGQVRELQLWLHHGDNPRVKAELLALLELKYGQKAAPVKTPTGRDLLMLGERPRVEVGETSGAWVVSIASTAP